MTALTAFILGLLTSRWLEGMLTRAALRVSLPDKVRSTLRERARERELDLKERGRIIRLADADAADALAKPGALFDDAQGHERP